MKLMKLMFAGIMVMGFAMAQECDPNMDYPNNPARSGPK